MKEQLLQLYRQQQPSFRNLVSSFPNEDLAGPFLMSPGKHYQKQNYPLLLVGQETKGWSYHIDEIEKQMQTYERYNVGSELETNAFWNISRKIEHLLGNDPCSCAWTNVSRFDLYGGRAHGKYEKAIAHLDRLICEEIKIVAPKVCLFFTGPDFDRRLKNIFEDIEFIEIPGWKPSQLCLLKHAGLPVYTFRSYHPKSLKLHRLEDDFMKTISDFIRVGITIN
ncbi:MAG: hypothetical protein PSX36_09560 [bacterium]|nr:hypothetical protein [bacterium]